MSINCKKQNVNSSSRCQDIDCAILSAPPYFVCCTVWSFSHQWCWQLVILWEYIVSDILPEDLSLFQELHDLYSIWWEVSEEEHKGQSSRMATKCISSERYDICEYTCARGREYIQFTSHHWQNKLATFCKNIYDYIFFKSAWILFLRHIMRSPVSVVYNCNTMTIICALYWSQ